MRVAVISDIHANLHALEAVAGGDRPGGSRRDLVPRRPRRLRRRSRTSAARGRPEHADVCLAGNHDLGVLGTLDLADFSDDAAAAASWTRGVLDAERARLARRRCASSARARGGRPLPREPARPGLGVRAHLGGGARRDPRLRAPTITLVGHSHVPLAIVDGRGAIGGHAPGGTEIDLDGGRWLLNPGSVGQPRDGDPDAAWLLLDLDARHASFRRVPYDVARTQAEIRERRATGCAGGAPRSRRVAPRAVARRLRRRRAAAGADRASRLAERARLSRRWSRRRSRR